MRLIIASLDEASRRGVPSARASEQRVERLIARNTPAYEYIIDYWGRSGVDIDPGVSPMKPRISRIRPQMRFSAILLWSVRPIAALPSV